MGTAVKKTPVNINLSSPFSGYRAIPVLINYDTPNEDLTISSPGKGQSVLVVGLQGVCSDPSTQTFKSNSTTIFQMQLAGNSGLVEPFSPASPKVVCNTEPNETLKFNCDVALPPFLMYILEV